MIKKAKKISSKKFTQFPTGILVLENKVVFKGIGIGYQGSATGEVCFNTSLTGYQEIISQFFKKVKNKKFKQLKLPRFDKSIDDRCPKKLWYKINFRPDVIILEGWCVGAKAQKNSQIFLQAF